MLEEENVLSLARSLAGLPSSISPKHRTCNLPCTSPISQQTSSRWDTETQWGDLLSGVRQLLSCSMHEGQNEGQKS
jgi:hypothetical protein